MMFVIKIRRKVTMGLISKYCSNMGTGTVIIYNMKSEFSNSKLVMQLNYKLWFPKDSRFLASTDVIQNHKGYL